MKMKLPRAHTAAWVAGITMATCLLGNGGAALAQGKYHTPKVGSAERKGIMDALRVPVQKDLGFPVIFVVRETSMFRVVDDWAFISAQFRHPDGSPMGKNYFGTGMRSDTTQALLHKVNGKWKVVTHVTGATDVQWEGWAKKYGAPSSVIYNVNPG